MSVTQALFTPSQSKLLEWIFGQPARWFHIQELLRLTSLGSASLQREIKRLQTQGLVSEERIGNLRRIKANANNPVFDDLVSIVRKTLGVTSVITDALRPLAGQLHVALLFGSVAKGTEHAESDIDVLLVSNSLSLHDALTVLLPLEQPLGRRIEVKLYTQSEFDTRRQEDGSVIQRILATTPTLLYGSLE